MNYVDIVLLVFIGVGAMLGLFHGFVREVVSTIGILLAAIAANLVSPWAHPVVGRWIDENTTTAVVVWVVIFFVTLFFLNRLATLVNRLLKAIMLGGLNTFLGGLFGALKYTLIACLIVTFLEFVCDKMEGTALAAEMQSSRLVPYVHDVVGFISPYAEEYVVRPAKELL